MVGTEVSTWIAEVISRRFSTNRGGFSKSSGGWVSLS